MERQKSNLAKIVLSLIFLLLILCVAALYKQNSIKPESNNAEMDECLILKSQSVTGKIVDQVAKITSKQTFYNNSNRSIEGVYLFPLPEKAVVTEFKMYADGKVLKGELLSKEKAKKIYEQYVRRMIDPAILELLGNDLYRAKIFPIPPKGKRTIEIQYSSILPKENGFYSFHCLLKGTIEIDRSIPFSDMQLNPPNPPRAPSPERYSDLETDQSQCVVNLQLKSKIPVKTLYSPNPSVEIIRTDDHHARISYEKEGETGGFWLYYSLSDADFGANVLSYKPQNDEDGYFMLFLSPKVEFPKKAIQNKDVIFLLDKSGSMEGVKIEQAKAGLKYCLNHLNRGDRFGIITFASEVNYFKDKLVPIKTYRKKAIDFVEQIEANGGTNINDAVIQALKFIQKHQRPTIIVLISDGDPTVGEINPDTIINNVKKANKANIRIFTFGIGDDVETYLLDKLAVRNHGDYDYIFENQNIENKITQFYNRIDAPVLTNLKIDFLSQGRVYDVYPRELTDLFEGQQKTILGRFTKSGKFELKLRGGIEGRGKNFSYKLNFTPSEDCNFLPQIWASRKIGFLTEQYKLSGENKELKNEIESLASKYGIASPLTSFLVSEDLPYVDILDLNADSLLSSSSDLNFLPNDIDYALNMPLEQPAATASDFLLVPKSSIAAKVLRDREKAVSQNTVKYVQNRKFIFNPVSKVWHEAGYKNEETITINRYGTACKSLLLTFPELSWIWKFRDDVIFKFKNLCIKISDNDGIKDARNKRFIDLLEHLQGKN